MNTIRITRLGRTDTQTLGRLEVLNPSKSVIFTCHTLELPWRNNARRISCIPPGTYPVAQRTSAKYGRHLHILNVPNRDMILIHEANFVHQLLGCIAVGRTVQDINGDGVPDITSSVATKNELLTHITGPSQLTII